MDKSYKSIERELAKIRGYKAAACKRIIAQAKAGEWRDAALSCKAYSYCSDYEKRLDHILDGYKHTNSSTYFTKDGKNRYRKRTGEDSQQ